MEELGVGLQRVIERLFHSKVEATVRNKEPMKPIPAAQCLLKVLTLFISMLIGSALHSDNGSLLFDPSTPSQVPVVCKPGLCFIDRAELLLKPLGML